MTNLSLKTNGTKKKNKKNFIYIAGNEELVENLKQAFKRIIATLSTEDLSESKITT